jgi:hypothetical protein
MWKDSGTRFYIIDFDSFARAEQVAGKLPGFPATFVFRPISEVKQGVFNDKQPPFLGVTRRYESQAGMMQPVALNKWVKEGLPKPDTSFGQPRSVR